MTAIRAISLVFLCLFCAGCATDGAALPSVACHVFHKIQWSHKDTRETVRQIVGHNAAGHGVGCW